MLVRRIRNRGANIVVEANGEVLFAPGSDLSRWKNRFSQRVRTATELAAPTNKRVRWAHYGKPLKSTMTASTSTRLTKGGGFFYVAVGSTAPHAYYVDQGTGIYAGNRPYMAKILPPWQRGEGSLYEHTWRPTGQGGRRVKPVYIKGQRPQGFFDTGLKRGMQSMRLRSYQVPGEGVSGMRSAMSTFPEGLAGFKGNTAADTTFVAQLQEWRKWRDDSWARNMLGRNIRPEREPERKSTKPPKAAKPPKPPKKPTKPKPPKQTPLERALAAAKREMAAYKMRHPQDRIAGYDAEGFIVIYGTGQQKKVYWSPGTADLFVEAGEYT